MMMSNDCMHHVKTNSKQQTIILLKISQSLVMLDQNPLLILNAVHLALCRVPHQAINGMHR